LLWRREWGSSARDRLFVHKRILSAVRKVEFISDGMSCIILRGRWCSVIVLNVHAPWDDVKDSFCEEIGRVSDHFPRYCMNILFGDFNGKVGGENTFKPKVGN
jgi:hypothetical protein